jgi:hypothetical protein
MGPPPSLVSTENVKYDNNYCMKNIFKPVNGEYMEWQILSGMINDN